MIERDVESPQLPLPYGAQSSARLLLLFGLLALSPAAQAIEKFSCTEHWFDTSKEDVRLNPRQADRIQSCAASGKDNLARDTGYRFVNGQFYQYSAHRKRRSPCTANGVGNMGQMLDPVCWMPNKLQLHRTEVVRTFWLATTRLQAAAQSRRCKRCETLTTPNTFELDIPELAVPYQIGE